MTAPTATTAQIVQEHDLSPAMVQALLNGAENNFAGAFDAGRHTEGALERRGLAEALFGTAERPAYRRTGVYGSTTTVYDAYLGICWTDKGRKVAALLLAAQEK
ncbi:hypothetical protein AB0395_34785 [Streptosporangium sp. NPDC051023]|uniref:hypothetical protein n=1 Tax=Streptosporangium sp. NPDC051023 TaxID=3155410 RepID=UPI00344F0DDB